MKKILAMLAAVVISSTDATAFAQSGKQPNSADRPPANHPIAQPNESSLSAKQNSSNARQAADFLKELDVLKPEEISSKAESLSNDLLSQLRYGPAMEQTKQRRAAWQRLRVELAKDMEGDEALLNQLRTRLATQLEQVESQSQGDSAAISARSRAIAEASADSIRTLQRRIDRLREQVAVLDRRIREAVTSEQTITDRMDIAKTATRDSNGFDLPDDLVSVADVTQDRPARTVTKSPSDKFRTNKTLADLLKDLGIKPPQAATTASASNRKER